MKVSIISLGCKVNQAEGEDLIKEFAAAGVERARKGDPADIVIVNTCTVTGEADRKSRKLINQSIRNQAQHDAYVVVTGCYAEIAGDDLRAIPGVDMVIGQTEKDTLVERVIERLRSRDWEIERLRDRKNDESICPQTANLPSVRQSTNETGNLRRHRAFLKIQDGCDNRCAYCIVPDARGRPRGLPEDEVMTRAADLSAGGTRELVLTGINIGKYGDLPGLIKRLLDTPGLGRIRLSSIEPEDVTDELIGLFAEDNSRAGKIERLRDWKNLSAARPTILHQTSNLSTNTRSTNETGNLPPDRQVYLCPHLHIPLQSGDAETLKRMKRRYTVAGYEDIVAKVRAACPDVAITTDIIVGFPGETAEAFQNTYRFLEKAGIARLHVFKYSKREGTPAAEMTGQVTETVKAERSEALRELSTRLEKDYRKRFAGRELEVLVERAKGKSLTGTSENYLTVSFPGDRSKIGQIVKVKLED